MSEHLKNALVEAINDEYKARATYRAVIQKFGEIRPFINIVEAEGRHANALLPLFTQYHVDIPEDDWASRVQVPDTVLDACRLAVEDEIENAEMYERLLKSVSDYPDVVAVLKQLQRASVENHLPAFQRCVAREQGSGRGRGQGHRRGQHREKG